jgi:hypothetical protein
MRAATSFEGSGVPGLDRSPERVRRIEAPGGPHAIAISSGTEALS